MNNPTKQGQTYDMVRNRNGNLTMLGMVLTLFTFSMLILIIFLEKKYFFLVRSRFSTYLCFKHHVVSTDKYLARMNHLNQAIIITYPLTLAPPTAAKAKIALNTLKVAQNILHASFVKNITKNSYCTYQQNLSSIINIPYETYGRLVLKRTPNQAAIIRKQKWRLIIPDLTRYQNSVIPQFYLDAHFSMTPNQKGNYLLSSAEIKSNRDLPY